MTAAWAITKWYILPLSVIICNSPVFGRSEKFAIAQSQPRSHGCISNVAAGERLSAKANRVPCQHRLSSVNKHWRLPPAARLLRTSGNNLKRLTGDAAMKLHLMLHFIVSESHYILLFSSPEAFGRSHCQEAFAMIHLISVSWLFVWILCRRPGLTTWRQRANKTPNI